MRGIHIIISLLYLIFGVYLVNIPFKFLEIPALLLQLDKWVFLVSGILLIFGAFLYNQYSNRFGPIRR